jgi:hypothetical protein
VWTILWTGPNPKNPAKRDVNARSGSRFLRLEAQDPAAIDSLDFEAIWNGGSPRAASPAPLVLIDALVADPAKFGPAPAR